MNNTNSHISDTQSKLNPLSGEKPGRFNRTLESSGLSILGVDMRIATEVVKNKCNLRDLWESILKFDKDQLAQFIAKERYEELNTEIDEIEKKYLVAL